jgi:predicted O-methyltransferase YrrM
MLSSRIKNLTPKLEKPFDLIFIDADKISYPTYLSLILSLSQVSGSQTRLLRPGGLIMADNVLRRGLIADSSDANPWTHALKQQGETAWREGDMRALDEFNKMLAKEERLETFLMPMFDGLGLAILRD